MRPKPQKRRTTNAANLEPHTIRDSERARELGRLGGIASGEARREKRSLRAWAELLRDQPPPDGVEGETNAGAAIVATFREAQMGNIQAVRFLSELLGELDAPDTFAGKAPPPPIVIGIHDATFIEAERTRQDGIFAGLAKADGQDQPTDAAGAPKTPLQARGNREGYADAPGRAEGVEVPSRSPDADGGGDGEADGGESGTPTAPEPGGDSPARHDPPQPPKPLTRAEAVAALMAKREAERAADREAAEADRRRATPCFTPFGMTRRR